jgi:hypothetical protein
MIFKNGFDLSSSLVDFINNSECIYIYTAYIKLETLKALIESSDNVKAVFVRWEPKDLITGASDLEIYPYLKSKGISLYRNPRIHLKVYLDGFKRCFITSANISSRALNLPVYANYNYEIGTITEEICIEDRLYFNTIENESILITDAIYKQLNEQLTEKKKKFPNEDDFKFDFNLLNKNFLISSLPMTHSIYVFLEGYFNLEDIDEETLNCIIHDLVLYQIPIGNSKEELLELLNEKFFNHPFIKAFLNFVERNGGEIYFGRAKEWIHQNCENVPLPKRWEITKNIQILYRWIEYLSTGKYKIDSPNYSERLFKVF